MGKDLSECLKLLTEKDGVEGYLLVTPGYDPDMLTADTLLTQLHAIGVAVRWLDRDAVEGLATACQDAPLTTNRALVARGCSPTHGINGSLELHPRISDRIREIEHRAETLSATTDSDLESDEVTDFRSQSAFIFVYRGQEIANLILPTDGIDGQDVFGSPIAAKAGRPCTTELGDGLEVDDLQIVRASVDGVLRHTALRIFVDETLKIQESVDYSTGNIDFTGDVEVGDQVRDCFIVDSGGSIKIRGLVEAATIRAQKELNLSGGMAGREKGEFFAGGGLHARYIDRSKGVVHLRCVIEKEMNSCDLTVYGEVDSPNAAMRGGRCSATMGMTIGILGGAGGIATEVYIGDLPEPASLIVRTLELMQELEGAAAEATTRLDQLVAATATIPESLAKELEGIKREIRGYNDQLDDVRDRALMLTKRVTESTSCHLKIMRKVSPGVRIWFPGCQIEVRDEIKGPIEFILDQKRQVQLVDLQTGSALTTEGVLRITKDMTILPIPDPAEFQPPA